MLKTSSGHNVKKEYVSENLWKEIIQATRIGIDMKISALKNLISLPNNEAILTGLYTYVVEEFGKIILLSKCQSVKNRREITYKDEFLRHEAKFAAALDYLQANRFEEAYVLNNKGSYSHKSFSWRSYNIGLLADFQSRLSIFYQDLEYDISKNVTITKPPMVDKKLLEVALKVFEKAFENYPFPIL